MASFTLKQNKTINFNVHLEVVPLQMLIYVATSQFAVWVIVSTQDMLLGQVYHRHIAVGRTGQSWQDLLSSVHAELVPPQEYL